MLKTRMPIKALDIDVTPMTAEQVVIGIRDHVSAGVSLRIGNFNLHGAYLYHTNADFARYCDRSDVLLVDGWPIWALGKIGARSFPGVDCRIGSSDWLKLLLETSDAPIKIVAIGGTAESSRLAEVNIQKQYPAVSWQGFDGFESTNRISSNLAHAIEEADLVLVGMGMPTQEAWIEDNHHLLKDKIVANVGGCIDYFAGTQKHAPRWTGKLGLEWLFRLVASPRRLWRRYLLEPFQLMFVLMVNQPKRRTGE